jgi:hypothetical protein
MKGRWKAMWICLAIAAVVGFRLWLTRVPLEKLEWPEGMKLYGDRTLSFSTSHVDFMEYARPRPPRGLTAENNAAIGLIEVLGARHVLPGYPGDDAWALDFHDLEWVAPLDGMWEPFHHYVFRVGLYDPAQNPDAASRARVADFEDWGEYWVLTRDPWSAEAFPELATWLAEQEGTFDHLAAAMARPLFYLPGDVAISYVRWLAEGVLYRAMARIHDGDLAGAWTDILTIRRLGRHIDSQVDTINTMMASSFERHSAHAQMALLNAPGVTPALLRQMQADIASLPSRGAFADVVDVERLWFLDEIQTIYADEEALEELMGWECPQEYVQWSRVAREMDAWAQQHVVAARATTYAEFHQATELIDAAREERDDRRRRDGIRGYLAQRMPRIRIRLLGRLARGAATDQCINELRPYMASLENLNMIMRWSEARAEMADLAIVVRLYELEQGSYPGSLDDLLGEYIEALPIDYYTGQPYRYVAGPDGCIIYSLGHNGVDDNGLGDRMSDADRIARGIASRDDIPDDADDIAVVLGSVDITSTNAGVDE